MPLTHSEARALSPGALLIWTYTDPNLHELVRFVDYSRRRPFHIEGRRLRPQYQTGSVWAATFTLEEQARLIRDRQFAFQDARAYFLLESLSRLPDTGPDATTSANDTPIDLLRRLL
jgi:hypothetical protein